ncbi:MAG: hypothetical protein IJO75_06810 [Clostridia bacterium]|nr:hypothetical protein [Clostridia bacterium]
MIKGISRQIVEVTDTTNPYFERVFFIVRQQCKESSPALLDAEAHRLVNTATGYTGLKRARRLRLARYWGLFLMGVGIGALTLHILTII